MKAQLPRLKVLFTITLCLLFFSHLKAQTNGPSLQWKLEDWAQVNFDLTSSVSQDESGDDWYYNHTKVYENGVQVGYIACGYSTFPNANVILSNQNNCYQYNSSQSSNHSCAAFEKANDVRGPLFQMMMRYDMDGNVVWCKRYNENSLFDIIQDSDGNFVAIGITHYVEDKFGNPISYNPTVANPRGTVVSCPSPANYERKMNVIKIDLNGNVLWNYIYSMPDANTSGWLTNRSEGWGLIEYNNGYRLVGNYDIKAFMVQINKSGQLLNKQSYTYYDANNNSYDKMGFFDIAKSSNGDIAVSGDGLYSSQYDALLAHFPKNNNFNANFIRLNPSTNNTDAKSVFVSYLAAYDVFALPVFYNGNLHSFSGEADCEIHFFAGDFNPATTVPSTIQVGHYKAFDLKMGIAETDDGFATVSSKQPNGVTTYTPTIQALLTDRYPNTTSGDCPGWFDSNIYPSWMGYWDTDASVAKYTIDPNNLNVAKVWESTFDYDNKPREYFPGDIKRQECLYGITVDDADGAIVISGNTSSNFDDQYLAKLYNDYCIGLSYDISDPSDNVVDINSNTTWNSSKTVIGQLRIKSGNTLTISGENTIIGFADSKRTGIKTNIFIEQNAILVVDGATLTGDSRCSGSIWEGIILDGDNNNDQMPLNQPLYQAKLELKNNALLDNTMYAISYGVEGEWNDFGGLVQAEDATIRSTRRAIEFMSYPFHNNSSFTRCTFEYVPTIEDPPLSLITNWDNHGAVFRGCTFADNTGINQYSENNGNGISSIDGSYTVTFDCNMAYPISPCPARNYIPSSFHNFNQGIFATGAAGMHTISVDETDFYDNSMAFRVEGFDNVRFTLNDVLTGGLVKDGYYDLNKNRIYQMGFYSKDATGYEVAQNTFEQRSNAQEDVVGVNIIKSGADANEVYKNTFKNNAIGQKYDERNRNAANNYEGLQFLCNNNVVDNVKDVQINKGSTPPYNNDDGIRIYQGNSNAQKSAGNLFSTNPQKHIENNSAQGVFYYYHGSNEKPTLNSGIVAPLSVNNSNTCPDKYWSAGTEWSWIVTQSIIPTYYQNRQNYDDLLYTYYQNIDNGNTDSLLDAIGLYFPTDAQDMRNDLMSQTPYLSEQALRDAAATGILTDALLLEVCLANPDATQSGAFLDYLQYEIPNPLPSNMIQLIYQSWGGETPRTLIENQLADLNAKLGRTSSKLIHWYAMDTAPHLDSIRAMIESRKTLNSKYQLVDLDIQEGNYTLALSQLDDIVSNNELNAEQLTEHNNLTAYVNFRKSLQTAGITYMQLNENQLTELRTIATTVNTNRSAAYAQNILCFGYGECDWEQTEPQARLKSSYPKRMYDFSHVPSIVTNKMAQNVTINPNPTSGKISVLISGRDNYEQLQFRIKNMSGQAVFKQAITSANSQYNLEMLGKGVFVYEIIHKGERIAVGKLVIQ